MNTRIILLENSQRQLIENSQSESRLVVGIFLKIVVKFGHVAGASFYQTLNW